MELLVTNIGKIESAELELNGLTVITGYNGTGKSTLCKALYSIMDTLSDLNAKVSVQRKNSIRSVLYKWEENLLDSGLEPDYCDKISSFITQYIITHKDFATEQEMRQIIQDICKDLQVKISDETVNVFVEKYNDIIEKDKEEYIQFIVSRDVKGVFRNQIGHVNYKDKYSQIELRDEQKIWSITFTENGLTECLCKYNTLKRPIYIEPQSVLDGCDVATMGSFYMRRSNNVIQDILLSDKLRDSKLTLEEYQAQEENLKVINEILEDVTKGQLVSGQNNHRLSYSEKGLKEDIVCGNIASGLKSFLIIRRLIENGALGAGRTLIIDEPEVNLHPEWQLAFAKVLVLLNLKLDIRVVLSTHSPYFLRAIEYYMKEYENSSKGKYYLTAENENGLFTVKDVTENKEFIYKALYRPLEDLD